MQKYPARSVPKYELTMVIKKLVEEVNGWMIKRLGYKIKDSGLV